MGILCVDLNNIKLDDANFAESAPETIVHIRLLAWHSRFKQYKACEKNISKELMPEAWHPTRWWDWCMSKDKKKKERDRAIFD